MQVAPSEQPSGGQHTKRSQDPRRTECAPSAFPRTFATIHLLCLCIPQPSTWCKVNSKIENHSSCPHSTEVQYHEIFCMMAKQGWTRFRQICKAITKFQSMSPTDSKMTTYILKAGCLSLLDYVSANNPVKPGIWKSTMWCTGAIRGQDSLGPTTFQWCIICTFSISSSFENKFLLALPCLVTISAYATFKSDQKNRLLAKFYF